MKIAFAICFATCATGQTGTDTTGRTKCGELRTITQKKPHQKVSEIMERKFKLEITMENAAFDEEGHEELARILSLLAGQILVDGFLNAGVENETGAACGLWDINGNHCGFWKADLVEPPKGTLYRVELKPVLAGNHTAAEAGIEEDDLRWHPYMIRADCPAHAKEMALDQFHSEVPIKMLEFVDIWDRVSDDEPEAGEADQ